MRKEAILSVLVIGLFVLMYTLGAYAWNEQERAMEVCKQKHSYDTCFANIYR